jgi:hypothetical protein
MSSDVDPQCPCICIEVGHPHTDSQQVHRLNEAEVIIRHLNKVAGGCMLGFREVSCQHVVMVARGNNRPAGAQMAVRVPAHANGIQYIYDENPIFSACDC